MTCSYYVVLPLSLLPEGLWRRLSHVAWPRRAPDALAVLMRMRSVFAALPPPALLVRSFFVNALTMMMITNENLDTGPVDAWQSHC